MSKRALTVIAMCALFGAQALAQSISTPTQSLQGEDATKGFRVAIIRPILKAKIEIEGYGVEVESDSEKIDSTTGISIGYAKVPVKQVGFIGSFSYLKLSGDGDDIGMWRANGNAALGLNSNVLIYGGLNMSNLIDTEIDKYIDPGFGGQVGVGLQLNKNFGLDVGYAVMSQTLDVDGFDGTIREFGPELSVHATF